MGTAQATRRHRAAESDKAVPFIMSDQLLTVDQVCEILHLSRPTVYHLIRDGQLPSLKIRNARRIPADAVADFIDERVGTRPKVGS